jgi:chemotaxis signal transduction protein
MNMPHFRSTAAFTHRRRATGPVIDRATFVCFTLASRRFAIAVESVERVLRVAAPDAAPDHGHVAHAGKSVPVVDLSRALALTDASPRSGDEAPASPALHAARRTLIVTVHSAWIALVVQGVSEVATIDAALVQPLPAQVTDVWTDASASRWPTGARGVFARHDHPVVVLDMARVMRTLFEMEQAARVCASALSAPAVSAPAVSAPAVSAPAVSAPAVSAPAVSA